LKGIMQPGQTEVTVKFDTARFGEVEIAESEVLTLPEGLLGFQPIRRYAILKDPEEEPFLWLQSMDEASLSFVVVDPFIFFPGYEIQIKSQELSSIQLDDLSNATVLVIVTVPEEPMDLTANLRGPLVINTHVNQAKQLVLIDDKYHTKHYLLKDIPPFLADPASPENFGAGKSVNE